MAKGKPTKNWKEKVIEWESSGKTAKVWCQENKIPYTTLLGWNDRLKKSCKNKDLSKTQPEFIELKDSVSLDPGVVFESNGIKIHLQPDFNRVILKECLQLLRDLSC